MSKLKIIEIKIAIKFTLNTKKPSITNALPNNKLTILIYVGLISLSLIIIGYKNNDFNKLFIFGIILTIINILVQLRDILVKKIILILYLAMVVY